MPETPDFERIALTIEEAQPRDGDFAGLEDVARLHATIVEQLRLVWNARGAADIARLDGALSQMMGSTASGPYVKNLDRALRTLDR
jgi:hypothetical protein